MAPGCDPVYPDFPAEAVGFYNTRVVTLFYADAIIDNLLPRKLERAPQSIAPAGQHPVTMLFGRHSHVRPNFIPFGGMNYFEFIFAIPFVQWKDASSHDYRGPFAYMPRMYLDQLLPTLLGYMYAYPKELARIRGGDHYDVHSLVLDHPLLRGDFTPHGVTQPPDDFANFANLRPVFEQPFIGKYDLGPYVCSKLTFELDQAEAQACDAVVQIQYEFVDGITPAVFHLPGLDASPVGAFELAVPWTMTLPFNCRCIGCA